MPCIRLKLYSLCVELIVILIVIQVIEKRTGCVEKEFRSKFVLQVWTISRELIETVQLNVHFFINLVHMCRIPYSLDYSFYCFGMDEK